MSSSRLQQGMSQQLGANASMQLSAQILQCSTQELAQLIQQAMASNPTLEESEPKYDLPEEEGQAPLNREASSQHDFMMDSLSASPSLQEHLKEEVSQSGLSSTLSAALYRLIDSLNPRGFFDEPPEKIAAEEQISPEILKQALHILHDLEPAGIGARNVQESLLIQLAQQGESKGIAANIIRENWDELIAHDYEKIALKQAVSPKVISEAVLKISHLSPAPGLQYSAMPTLHIEPDLLIWINEYGKLDITLTKHNIPELTLSASYKEMLAESSHNTELRQYLSKHFREARELIGAIAQRQQNILRVGTEIMKRQQEFFLHGSALQPMRMEEIADALGTHVSTISRAVAQKYVRSPQGMQALRSFFQGSIHQTSGEDTTASNIQKAIQTLIKKEDPSAPLSDEAIAIALERQNIQIARRTIAKYRNILHILPAQQRRKS